MAKNKALELTVRIAGQVDKSLLASVRQTNSMLGTLTSATAKVGKVGLATMAAGAVATAAALTKCTKAAAELENGMAPVARYVEGLADSAGKISDTLARNANGDILNGKTYKQNYEALRGYVQDLSTDIPRTTDQLMTMSAALGQSGKNVVQQMTSGILRDTAVAATAMDLDDQTAGDYMAKWEASFNFTHDQVMRLMDQINYLGANNATTAAEIAQSVNQSASMGQIAGVDPAATAAMATAMQATGVATDRVGTSITRIYTNLSKGKSASGPMQEMWKEMGMTAEGVAKSMQSDGVGTLLKVFRAIQNLPSERRVAALSTLFGQWAIEGGAKITQNIGLYTKALEAMQNPGKYTGSMEREFIIQASTPEAVNTMMANARTALAQDLGLKFLPLKKQVDTAMLGLFNQLRKNTPELKAIAGTLADLLSGGINKLTAALERGLPVAQKAMDYLAQHGDGTAKTLAGLAAAFGAMTLAPAAGGLLSGGAELLLGSRAAPTAPRRGGLLNVGQAAAENAGTVWSYAKSAGKNAQEGGGLVNKLLTGAAGGLSAAMNLDLLNSRSINVRDRGIARMNGVMGTIWKDGFFPAMGQRLAGSGLGRYVQGVGSGVKNLWQNSGPVSAFTGKAGSFLGGMGGAVGQILGNILGSNGPDIIGTRGHGTMDPKPLDVRGFAGGVKNVTGVVGNGALSGLKWLGGIAANTGPGEDVLNAAAWLRGKAPAAQKAAGGIANFAGAGAGLLSNIWSPAAGMLGGLVTGVGPAIAAVSAVIAVVSILGDHLDDIQSAVYNTFGPAAAANVGKVGRALKGAFGFLNAMVHVKDLKELRSLIFNTFGQNAAVMVNDLATRFPGLTKVILSVLGVAGQVVDFATGTVKPIIEQIFGYLTGTALPTLVRTFSSAAPAISQIISGVGTAVMGAMTIIGTAIQAVLPVVGFLVTALLNGASVVVPAVLAWFGQFAGGLGTVVQSAKTIFQGLLTFLSGVFTGRWGSIWQGIRQIFSGAFSGLAALVKIPINAVIALINKAISGINDLGIDIPKWVPKPFGGKKFALNIPAIPMLAKGGFTNGVSIAGEAGREAVISFQRSVRGQNIATWQQAGRMLGVTGNQAAQAVGLKRVGGNGDWLDIKDPGPGGNDRGGQGDGGLTVNIHVTVNGNADSAVLDEAMRRAKAEFEAWYRQMKRDEARRKY